MNRIKDGQLQINIDSCLANDMEELLVFLGKSSEIKSLFILSESKTSIMVSRRSSQSQMSSATTNRPSIVSIASPRTSVASPSSGADKRLLDAQKAQHTRKLVMLLKYFYTS